MSRTILHWQIASPFGVQGWIGGARRLRDYWAGSFLTSWLSACAMRALEDKGIGEVLFPTLKKDPLWQAMGDPDSTWFVGTLPNRFKARIDQPEFFCPGDDPCTQAAYGAWRQLAAAVWEYFIEPVAGKGKGTREIWERQIAHFWETNWVLGDDPGDGSDGAWLDRRKNWRTHVATQCEPGDHCRIFGDLQELSGWVRARGESKQQDAFWEKLREQVGKIVGSEKHAGVFELLELRPTERLSAPALVKRLFPCLPAETLKDVFGWIPQGQQQRSKGPARPAAIRFWPSTAYVAAVPWMRSAWEEVRDRCCKFATTARERSHVQAVAEHHSFVPSLEQADAFGVIDGQLLFEDALETEIRNAQSDDRKANLKEIRKALQDLLGAYRRKVEPQRQGRQVKSFTPSPFYALLLMDGDSIGSLLGKAIKAGAEADVSEALARFGREVPGIVRHHDGTLIYAGGDDVQAFLPLTEAIPCAVRLHDRYVEAMAPVREKLQEAARKIGENGRRACAPELSDEKLRDTTTISAALIFAHFHVPLAVVIREAHQLLDDVAKDGNGRDSIAIAVRKPSGTAARFVTRFDDHVAKLQKLAHKYATDPERSTSFLYDLKDRYGHVLEMFAEKDDDLRRLLLAEWCLGRRPPTDRDREAVDDLLKICRRVPGPKKEKGKEKETESKKERFDISAALIARFLADQGVGTLELRRDPCQTPATT